MFNSSPEKRKGMLSPEDILRKTGRVPDIIQPSPRSLIYNNFPISDQLKHAMKGIAGLNKAYKKQLESDLLSYLQAPAIRTKFRDSDDKYEFELTLREEIGDQAFRLYESNRLKPDNINHVLRQAELLAVFDTLPDAVRETLKQMAEEIRAEVADQESKDRENFEAYGRMSDEEKIAVADRAAELAREISMALIESQKQD